VTGAGVGGQGEATGGAHAQARHALARPCRTVTAAWGLTAGVSSEPYWQMHSILPLLYTHGPSACMRHTTRGSPLAACRPPRPNMAGAAQACEESDISEGWVVACPCGAAADDGERMLECERCQTWQHAACVGAAAAAAPVFLCTRCAPSPADGAQGAAAAAAPAAEAGSAASREAAATPSATSGGRPAGEGADGAREDADGPAEAACALEGAPRQAAAEAAGDAAAGGDAAATHARPAKRCSNAEDAAAKVGGGVPHHAQRRPHGSSCGGMCWPWHRTRFACPSTTSLRPASMLHTERGRQLGTRLPSVDSLLSAGRPPSQARQEGPCCRGRSGRQGAQQGRQAPGSLGRAGRRHRLRRRFALGRPTQQQAAEGRNDRGAAPRRQPCLYKPRMRGGGALCRGAAARARGVREAGAPLSARPAAARAAQACVVTGAWTGSE